MPNMKSFVPVNFARLRHSSIAFCAIGPIETSRFDLESSGYLASRCKPLRLLPAVQVQDCRASAAPLVPLAATPQVPLELRLRGKVVGDLAPAYEILWAPEPLWAAQILAAATEAFPEPDSLLPESIPTPILCNSKHPSEPSSQIANRFRREFLASGSQESLNIGFTDG